MTYSVRFDPGDAVALVDRGIVVVLGTGGTRTCLLAAVEEVLEPCGFEAVVRRLAAVDLAELPSIVVVGHDDAAVRVLVRGQMSVQVDTVHGEQHSFDGTALTTWSEHLVESAVACRLAVGRSAPADPSGELPFSVRAGVVPMSRMSIAVPGWSERPAIEPGDDADLLREKADSASELIADPPLAPDLGCELVGVPEPHEAAEDHQIRVVPRSQETARLQKSAEVPKTAVSHSAAEADEDSGDSPTGEAPVGAALTEVTSAWSGDGLDDAPSEAKVLPSRGQSGDKAVSEIEELEFTSFRSVEDAAVRDAHEDPFPGQSEIIRSAPDGEGGASQADAPIDQSNAADHDGLTVSLSPRPAGIPAPRPSAPADRATIDPSAPVIPSARCTAGHLNPPYAANCRICGCAMTDEQFSAPRPSLGLLEFSDGQSVELVRSLLIGRAPRVEGPLGADIPALVTVESPGKEVSGLHLEVRLDDWQVLVVDRNSTNGTMVRFPDREPVRLRSGEAMPIVPGTSVNLADEVEFVFVVTS